MRIIGLPDKTYFRQRESVTEIRPLAESTIDQIITTLTRPLTADEANPKPTVRETEKPIKVSGEDANAALEKVNQLFLENRWSDGLPIVPPTEKAVRQMLSGTNRSPAEVIGLVPPKNGEATIRKIAVNAVMAGAKPEYLPVIIAGMEALTDRDSNLVHMQASTGNFTAAVIVSGPLAKELDFNSGIGMLGHGWRANSTVGRALRLCLLNIGQTWPGVNDMALTGRVSSYTFLTFAENQDESPWQPYHVDLGYKPEDSAVTVSTVYQGFATLGGNAVRLWTAQGILDQIVASIKSGGGAYGDVLSVSSDGKPINNEGSAAYGKYLVALSPDCAAELARLGYTRNSVREWIYNHASANPRQGRSPIPIEGTREEGGKNILVFVAGGSPGDTLFFRYSGPSPFGVTRKISGATLTKAGR